MKKSELNKIEHLLDEIILQAKRDSLSEGALDYVIKAMKKTGKRYKFSFREVSYLFSNLYINDFDYEKVNLKRLTKAVIEYMTKVGMKVQFDFPHFKKLYLTAK